MPGPTRRGPSSWEPALPLAHARASLRQPPQRTLGAFVAQSPAPSGRAPVSWRGAPWEEAQDALQQRKEVVGGGALGSLLQVLLLRTY